TYAKSGGGLVGCNGAARSAYQQKQAQRAVQPPSMRIVWPVIREAAGEARKTTAPETSTGSPMRWSAAIRSMVSARNAGSARASSVPGVAMKVGATAFTVMLNCPHSTARHFVRCETAALLAQ